MIKYYRVIISISIFLIFGPFARECLGAVGEPLFEQKRLSKYEVFPPQEVLSVFGISPSEGWLEGAKEAGEALKDDLQARLATASAQVNTLLSSYSGICTEMPSDAGVSNNIFTCQLPAKALSELNLPATTGYKVYSEEGIKTLDQAIAAYKGDLATMIAQKDSAVTKALQPMAMAGITSTIMQQMANGQPFYYQPDGTTHVLYLLQAYDSTASLPLTKMVLGNLKISIADISALGKAMYEKTIDPTVKKDQQNQQDIYKNLDDNDASIQEALNNAVKAFNFMMTSFPAFLLTCIFFVQVLSHVFGKAFGLQEAQGINAIFHVLRYMTFIVLIIFYKPVFMWLTDAFNLMSISIASIVEQSQVKSSMEVQLGIFGSTKDSVGLTNSLATFVNWVCAWVVQCAILITFIGRDIMLAFSAILGPTCIALGYYKNMTGKSNALGEYLSGWFGSYLRLMIWGIITAIVITSIALYCALGFSVNPSGLAMIIMSCIFTFVATSIPKYSQSLTDIAMQSLLIAVPASSVQMSVERSMQTVEHYTAGALGKGWSYLKSRTFSYSTSAPEGGSSGGGTDSMGETKSETGEATATQNGEVTAATTPPEERMLTPEEQQQQKSHERHQKKVREHMKQHAAPNRNQTENQS